MSKIAPTAKELQVKEYRQRKAMRILTVLAGIPVGLGALWVSYWHIVDVTLMAGESVSTAYLMPATVDGMLIVAGIMIASGKKGWLSYSAFGVGMAASLGANVVSASGSSVSYIVAAWPAITVALTFEMVLRQLVVPKKRPARKRKLPQTRTVTRSLKAVLVN
jgi:hypothetical protein